MVGLTLVGCADRSSDCGILVSKIYTDHRLLPVAPYVHLLQGCSISTVAANIIGPPADFRFDLQSGCTAIPPENEKVLA